MQNKDNMIMRRPVPQAVRAAIKVSPATALGKITGNHIAGSVGLFVDESNCPSDHHAELRTMGAHGGNER